MANFRIGLNGQEREFVVTRQGNHLHITSDDLSAEVELTDLATGGWSLSLVGKAEVGPQLRLRGIRIGDIRQMWINGRTLEATRLRRQASSPVVSEGALSAVIPAVVSEILVGVGDVVVAGDKLMLLESMKMVIPIEAPFAGRVGALNCTAGDSVAAGVPLVEIIPEVNPDE